jgi:cytochrome c-type biogenesis protein CcmH/NrfG
VIAAVEPIWAAATLAGLASIGAAGVVAGYRRPPAVATPVEDPLDDRRLVLLRSLADLEASHASGVLEDGVYERLRSDTESRLARVLRATDGRRSADPRPTRARGATSDAGARRIPSWLVAALTVSVVAAVTVTGIARNAEPAPASPLADANDPFAFFERRVREHPHDLAARLDLGQRYLDAMRVKDALVQYRAALALDPEDAEANAKVGLVLFLADRPRMALTWVDRALGTAPDYPEAHFIRGWILLDGLDRPEEAVVSLQRYLRLAPFGAERANARRLLARAER